MAHRVSPLVLLASLVVANPVTGHRGEGDLRSASLNDDLLVFADAVTLHALLGSKLATAPFDAMVVDPIATGFEAVGSRARP